MFELVAVRHGRTAWNAQNRYQGHTDVPLDEEGRTQARALAAALSERRFDVAVSSDLSRASETARIVLGTRGPELRLDAGWRELAFGTWEGLTWAQIVERYPEYGTRPQIPKFYTPENGESFEEACVRVKAALEGVRTSVPDGGTVLVATHAGPMHALLRIALGESEAVALGVRFSPCSLTRIAFERKGARLLELNRVPPP